MTDYVKSTNFASKDALATGNPLKIVKGTEIDTEFNNIATSIATKADLNSPTFIGTPAAPTATAGTNTTQLANTAFVKTAIDNYDAALTVSTSRIQNSAVTTDKLANSSVTTNKIADLNVTENKLANSSVTSDKLASNSVTTNKIVNANVTPEKLSQPFTSVGAVATTSGTSVSFLNIPSWVKRITVVYSGVSTNGVSPLLVQLGTSASIPAGTSQSAAFNYNSGSAFASTNGHILNQGTPAANTTSGTLVITLLSSSIWVSSGNSLSNVNNVTLCSGFTDLSGQPLTRLLLTTVNGTDVFDAGSVNVLYE